MAAPAQRAALVALAVRAVQAALAFPGGLVVRAEPEALEASEAMPLRSTASQLFFSTVLAPSPAVCQAPAALVVRAVPADMAVQLVPVVRVAPAVQAVPAAVEAAAEVEEEGRPALAPVRFGAAVEVGAVVANPVGVPAQAGPRSVVPDNPAPVRVVVLAAALGAERVRQILAVQEDQAARLGRADHLDRAAVARAALRVARALPGQPGRPVLADHREVRVLPGRQVRQDQPVRAATASV